MVLKEDGTKWACHSCLKGHRVSGCNHTDRELILVPKKGRPVTQCQHCRQERKKRSAHVSCDCGQPEKQQHTKEKCIHLREAEEKAKAAGYHDEHAEKDSAHLARVAEEQGCCCHHGGKCTCALLMKDPDNGSTVPHGPAVKPKLEKATSEGSITIFQNGHHKPVHRKNHAAHECGMPYKIPIPRNHTDLSISTVAHRSVDNLVLGSYQPQQSSPFAPQSGDFYNPERRKSKSENHSPNMLAFGEDFTGLNNYKPNSMDFTNTLSKTNTKESVQSTNTGSFSFSAFEPMSGLTDNSFDPLSAYPSADSITNNPFEAWPTSNEMVNMAQPALTAASSGTTSEIDEIPPIDDSFDFTMPSIQEIPDFGYSNLPPRNSPQANRRSLPPDMFSSIDFATPNYGNSDWQAAMQAFNVDGAGKNQNGQNRSSTSFDAAWQEPESRPIMSVAQRQLGGLPTSYRPQSRSVGPSSTPDYEVIRQLFPEMDFNLDMFSSSSPRMSNMSGPKDLQPTQTADPRSAPVNFMPMDDTSTAFTSQPWSDGSLSIPSDVITSPFPMDQTFSDPGFNDNWAQ